LEDLEDDENDNVDGEEEGKSEDEVQQEAMTIHMEVQQRADMRRDLAANMRMTPTEVRPGGQCYYWREYTRRIKQGKKGGRWASVVIVSINGPLGTVNTGTNILHVNNSKLRRPLESVDLDQLPDSRERPPNMLWII
jgi:hypothetical protein